MNKLKYLIVFLICSSGITAQYFNTQSYVLQQLGFENKALAKLLTKTLNSDNATNSLLDFIKAYEKFSPDSVSIQDKISAALVKSVYYGSAQKYKNALEFSIFAARASSQNNYIFLLEPALLLQAQQFYWLNSPKNIVSLAGHTFSNKDIEFQFYYCLISAALKQHDKTNTPVYCEKLLAEKEIKPYDKMQVLKIYAAHYEQNADYKKALEKSQEADSLIEVMKGQGMLNITDNRLFYNFVNSENIETKLLLENIISHNNIGFLHLKTNELGKAETVFNQTLKLSEKAGQSQFKQQIEKNIGLTHTLLKSYALADEHYVISEKISVSQNNSRELAEILSIRAKNQYLANNLSYASALCEKSIEIAARDKNYSQLSQNYSIMAEINAVVGDIQKASLYSRLAQENSDIARSLAEKADSESLANEMKEEALYDVFDSEKEEFERIQFKLEAAKRQQELELIKKEAEIKESNFHAQKLESEKSKQALIILQHELVAIGQQKEFERIRKDRAINILQNKNSQTKIKLLNKQKKLDDEIRNQREKEFEYTRKRERNLRIFLLIAACVIGLIIFLLYRIAKNSRLLRTTNSKLNETTASLQTTNTALESTLVEVNKQKQVIDTKNQQIMESIRYAERIQSASLPKMDELEATSEDCFVLYKPKDVISGDFYVVSQHRGPFENICDVYIVADCTGHGVPGAMLSLLCSSLVRQALTNSKLQTPAEILEQVNRQLKNFFRTKEDDAFKDGMDIACCMVDINHGKLYFASAGRPLIILKQDEELELKGEKYHIGFSNNDITFTNEVVDIKTGDKIYLFTDGYTDQFNGETRKRFTTKNFKNLLLSLQSQPMKTQGVLLDEEFERWKGKHIQMDDVCVIGIKI